MSQAPSLGCVVHYKLTEGDAQHITHQRLHTGGSGNPVAAGQVCPAEVVATFPGNPDGICNLKVSLDGPDFYWATSRPEGDEAGTWAWPERV